MANGVVRFIVQAHPAGYGDTVALQQMQLLTDMGVPWGSYFYEYLESPEWTAACLATLDRAAANGWVPDRLYNDSEDVSTLAVSMSVARRVASIDADYAAADAWSAAHDLAPTDQYSGAWWWNAYMGGTTKYADRGLWTSFYNGVPTADDVPLFGGWTQVAIKQYSDSTPLAPAGGVDINWEA